MADSGERRDFIRIRERLVLLLKNTATGRVHRTLTDDVSGSGLRLVTSELLEAGAEVEGELKLPDRNEMIVFAGVVAWSRVVPDQKRKSYEPPLREIGLKFTRIEPNDQALIQQHARLNAAS